MTDFSETLSLKIMLLNAENLFLLSDQKFDEKHLELDEHQWQKLSTSVYDNKSLRKCLALGKIISDENPDVIMLAEVGGPESLANFNHLFLKNRYSPVLVEGNSNRNIDVGYLIRKNMGFYYDLVSNKGRPINYLYPHERQSQPSPPSHRFSRDVAELHLFTKDRERPFLLFFLAHLKSRLDPEGIDPNGFERRQAELKTLTEIYNEAEKKYAGKIPIIVAGDFNGNASQKNTDTEFKPLYETTRLLDVCELAQLPADKTATYFQVGRNSRVDGRQIDYSFLSPRAAEFLVKESVKIYRYKDHLGAALPPPSTLDAKMILPSDHYPLLFELKNIPVVD
jgi:exonuclease III